MNKLEKTDIENLAETKTNTRSLTIQEINKLREGIKNIINTSESILENINYNSYKIKQLELFGDNESNNNDDVNTESYNSYSSDINTIYEKSIELLNMLNNFKE